MIKYSIQNTIVLVVILISSICCLNPSKSKFNFSLVKSHFIYNHKINSFNKDSIDHFFKILESKKIKPKAIINDLHLSIFQNDNELDTVLNEHTYYLYNVQSVGKCFKITVVGINNNWVNEILLLTYDNNGKLINKNILAQDGGDQDYYIESSSVMLNDSTYEKTIMEFRYSINKNKNELKSTKIERINF